MLAAGLAAMAIGAPAASAQTPPPERTLCNGELSGLIEGDVFVPRLGSCVLTRAIVTGNVGTAANSRSLRVDRSAVFGNLDCGQCRGLAIVKSAVGGTLMVRESSDGARMCGSAFGGAASFLGVGTALDLGNVAGGCSGNVFGSALSVRLTIGPATLERNVVAEDLTVTESRDTTTLNQNLIGGNLGCEENTVEPTGSGNFAQSMSGQCEGL
jgi:hypothetical protein